MKDKKKKTITKGQPKKGKVNIESLVKKFGDKSVSDFHETVKKVLKSK